MGYSKSGFEPAQGNFLLSGLPASDRALVSGSLEPVELQQGQALYDPDVVIEHVYFLDSGMVSLLGVFSDGTGVETAVIGREGMVGMPVFNGTDRMPEQAVMQISGTGHRMTATALRTCVEQSPSLRARLHHYSACVFMFAAQSVACMSKHETTNRLARWLLHASDHSGRSELQLTHLFLAHMLGVRRASVTVAAIELREANLITYTRKRVDITDRVGLEQRACECYGIIRSTYDRVIFGHVSPNPVSGMKSSHAGQSVVGSAHDKDAVTSDGQDS
jgi:CRP-like cAMP-binding protein